jgi:SAM-dependent methyltransferase
MDITGWNRRYLSAERASEDLYAPPTPLVVRTLEPFKPGLALDLACGAGRHSFWLAEHGWTVTAVDGAEQAIKFLEERADDCGLNIRTVIADLEARTYQIQPSAWDLILMTYYLQRDLFEKVKAGVKPGGLVIAIVHITQDTEQPTHHRAAPGELFGFFRDWSILHSYEGPSKDEAHRRDVAEIVAQRPL